MSFQNITPISAVAVAAGAANNPVSVEMDATLNEILIYVKNLGDSTNLTVSIESSPDAEGVFRAPLQPCVLNTTVRTVGIPVSIVPAYLWFTATNSDPTNATTYSVIISKRA
jgi:hypothetical protein